MEKPLLSEIIQKDLGDYTLFELQDSVIHSFREKRNLEIGIETTGSAFLDKTIIEFIQAEKELTNTCYDIEDKLSKGVYFAEGQPLDNYYQAIFDLTEKIENVSVTVGQLITNIKTEEIIPLKLLETGKKLHRIYGSIE